jgi:hypothetical protein
MIASTMDAVGFSPVAMQQEHIRRDLNLAEWIARVHERASCSLLTISDAAYVAGIERVERDIADPKMPPMVAPRRQVQPLTEIRAMNDFSLFVVARSGFKSLTA